MKEISKFVGQRDLEEALSEAFLRGAAYQVDKFLNKEDKSMLEAERKTIEELLTRFK